MNKNKIFTRLALLLLPLVFSAGTQAVAEDSKLKIAAMLCLTGECAEWGINSRRGIELAAQYRKV